MDQKTRPATKREIERAKQLLRTGRNRYDNEILKMEKVWAKLKPHDYTNRESLIKIALEMTKIDQTLKVWEAKLS